MKGARTSLALRLLTLTILAAAPLTAVTSAQASDYEPFGCYNHSWTNRDNEVGLALNGAVVHIGPHAGCRTVETYNGMVAMNYDCYVINEAGNSWTHVSTPVSGWVWDEYFDDDGSLKAC